MESAITSTVLNEYRDSRLIIAPLSHTSSLCQVLASDGAVDTFICAHHACANCDVGPVSRTPMIKCLLFATESIADKK